MNDSVTGSRVSDFANVGKVRDSVTGSRVSDFANVGKVRDFASRAAAAESRLFSLVSVREVHAALQSLRTIRRIEARRRKARAFRFRFSQSLAKRRQRLSQPIVLSTIQRFGRTTKPLAASERLTISSLPRRRTRFSAFWNFGP